ncbi:MAG: hypothetical protein M3N52_11105 [Actinomycetota bacterium]|nr:hypothetical protein [Actinomycetota bacterium]
MDTQRQARRLGHNHIGLEHPPLAVASAEGAAGDALHYLGIRAPSR